MFQLFQNMFTYFKWSSLTSKKSSRIHKKVHQMEKFANAKKLIFSVKFQCILILFANSKTVDEFGENKKLKTVQDFFLENHQFWKIVSQCLKRFIDFGKKFIDFEKSSSNLKKVIELETTSSIVKNNSGTKKKVHRFWKEKFIKFEKYTSSIL